MNYLQYANQECSSGCESGWTLYLDHSSISPYASCYNDQEICNLDDGGRNFMEAKRLKKDEEEREDEEDEDLSMVSDASSGPPHLHEEEADAVNNNGVRFFHDDAFCRNTLIINRKKNRENNNRRQKVNQDQSSLLDDTASSPFFDFSDKSVTLSRSTPSVENAMEYSQGYSSTQFEVRPPYQEHYDFFQSSQPGNHLQQNQWF